MKITKHYLPTRPTLGDWLDSTVPQAGMLVWLSESGVRWLTSYSLGCFDERVVAYARLDIDALATLADVDEMVRARPDLKDGRSVREKLLVDELTAERAKFAQLTQRLMLAHSALHVEQAAHETTKGEFERFKRDVAKGRK